MLHPSGALHKLNILTTSPVGQSPLIKMSERVIGTVKWFNDAKGLSLITHDENGQDIFVHYQAIESEGFRSLSEGQKVSFEKVQSTKGPQADHVRAL